jgi:hypothetical protein
MSLKILCAGYLVRCPLGGLSWHHLQYLAGFDRLGHEVMFIEHFGWPQSCYNPDQKVVGSDPSYGIRYIGDLFARCGLRIKWSYFAEDGSIFGASKEEVEDFCTDCDLYINLSNVNSIAQSESCRRRVLVDTDPVFTQIGAHGLGFDGYDVRFSYGELVHQSGCSMPTGNLRWIPTRQPVVLDLWTFTAGDPSTPYSTVINWASYPEKTYNGRIYGQRGREFEPYFSLPRIADESMQIAANAPPDVKARLVRGGWSLADPAIVGRNCWTYQQYIRSSRAEFCVAKHGYVATHCGWFSDRTTAYLASGRPAVVQDTGFSRLLPCTEGLLPYRSRQEAIVAIKFLAKNYHKHCQSARRVVEEFFDARIVLSKLLNESL